MPWQKDAVGISSHVQVWGMVCGGDQLVLVGKAKSNEV